MDWPNNHEASVRLAVVAGALIGLAIMAGLICALARQADCQLAHLDRWT